MKNLLRSVRMFLRVTVCAIPLVCLCSIFAPSVSRAQPIIDSLNIDEPSGEIEIWGSFGFDNQVFVQYTPLAIKTSTKSYLRCSIPDSGGGSCGELLVYSDLKYSEPRMITQWSMVFSKWFQHVASGAGFSFICDTLSIRFRMDMMQMIKRHRTEDFTFLSERATYHHSVAGGHVGIYGGQLDYGVLDTVVRGPIAVGMNFWHQQLNLPQLDRVINFHTTQPFFDPDYSIHTVFPSVYYVGAGGTASYVPLDGTSIAQFLPKDSLLWANIFGPTIIGPRCSIHLVEDAALHYERDSLDLFYGSSFRFDSGNVNRRITLDWNTSRSAHLTRVARTYLIIDTLQTPFPHEERIQVLMSDSSKNVDQISMQYHSLFSKLSDSLDASLSVFSVALTHSPITLTGFYKDGGAFDYKRQSYYHRTFGPRFGDSRVRSDTTMVGASGPTSFDLTFFLKGQDGVSYSSHTQDSGPGFLLREKLSYLVASGIKEIYDVLGRSTSIRGVTNATAIRPGLYFARIGQSTMKLLN
jgi:hypothetical protein